MEELVRLEINYLKALQNVLDSENKSKIELIEMFQTVKQEIKKRKNNIVLKM